MNENERAVTSVDKTKHLTERPRSEAGVLHSEMNIELHTRYAILLWEGQETEKKEKKRPYCPTSTYYWYAFLFASCRSD